MKIEHCEPEVIYGKARYGNMAHVVQPGADAGYRGFEFVGVSYCGVYLIHKFDPHHEPVCFRCIQYRKTQQARLPKCD